MPGVPMSLQNISMSRQSWKRQGESVSQQSYSMSRKSWPQQKVMSPTIELDVSSSDALDWHTAHATACIARVITLTTGAQRTLQAHSAHDSAQRALQEPSAHERAHDRGTLLPTTEPGKYEKHEHATGIRE